MAKGFGPFGKIQEALKKAQQVKEGAQKLQVELDEMEIVGAAGGGLVTVSLSGNQEPRGVTLAPEAMDKSAEELQGLFFEALQKAYAESTETMRTKMEELTGDISLPGLGF
ncbi:YbaB/EbfC family nucleoid-associated protein [Synechococcus sp. PCC 7336]|uniref:YbaB/EbfC family nucleoid-associated protein n=1 Tax=Synechococcus sp. PCC 7336 TaxID=195250 RepID=UPI00034DCB8B|nr:YbaB/EbfC family nucleoid-associated protein [Synechococcus sp. PCC 7336]